MPNYDPQNPTDLLGQPIKEGDVVANSITCGSSAAIRVCVIEKIRFTVSTPHGRRQKAECPREFADAYSLRLRPLKTEGYSTWIDTATGEEVYERAVDHKAYPGRYQYKAVSVQLVKNVVKLALTLPEAEALAYA